MMISAFTFKTALPVLTGMDRQVNPKDQGPPQSAGMLNQLVNLDSPFGVANAFEVFLNSPAAFHNGGASNLNGS